MVVFHVVRRCHSTGLPEIMLKLNCVVRFEVDACDGMKEREKEEPKAMLRAGRVQRYHRRLLAVWEAAMC